MKRFFPLLVLLVVLLGTSCHRESHFITDPSYRHQVKADFRARKPLLKRCFGKDAQNICRHLGCEKGEAMQFLMAYMPYSDMVDYDFEFFRQQVDYAFMARDTMPWGKMIPEDIFRHFVLVYRVNNENLDTARVVFFNDLKDRVRNLSMEEAALEVNHWCHEHVAYRGADARTSAPLATMRTSLGRCGEESTFAVTALRAVGIPARQCYTPRWAHCDDNHAWVEVWIATDDKGNGEWKHLGACEPDPELNMGWFDVPSTRCMMVHSKAFGRYHGDEEVVKETPLYSELNLLSHYAPTKKVTITVTALDAQCNFVTVQDAEVKFKLYNYAEYYTLATIKTDKNGQASLTTGLGDLLVWACKGDMYGYQKLDVREQDTLTIWLERQGEAAHPYIEELDMVPPVAGVARVTPTEEAVAANAKRIAYEDSLRAAYVATFHTTSNNIYVQKSEGNWAVVEQFLKEHPDREDYLATFSDKDLRDTPLEVLEQQLTTCPEGMSAEVYQKGILPARISNELVRPWRQPLAEALKNIKDYQALRKWTLKHVTVDDIGNYYNCPISPMGVYKLRCADPHSRDIFFVAACRSLQIPAYLDNATNMIYVHDNGEWKVVSWEMMQKPQYKTTLTLTYSGEDPATPIYYPHFTLQHYENGDFVTYDFEDDPRMATFPATIELDFTGYYCLSTGNRYPDGKVLSRLEFFSFDDETGDSITKEIVLRPLVDQRADKGLPKIDPAYVLYEDMGTTIADYAGGTGMLYINLGDYREPSKHLVKEMLEHRDEFKRWGGMIDMTGPSAVHGTLRSLANIDLGPQTDETFEQQLLDALHIDLKNNYPFVALIDNKGTILYHSEGYKIGLAEQLLKATRQ